MPIGRDNHHGKIALELKMVQGIDFFNTVEFLEPKCPRCNTKIEWGVNTRWDEKKETQVCAGCGAELK